jgi:hypothetical protein
MLFAAGISSEVMKMTFFEWIHECLSKLKTTVATPIT